LLDRITAAAPDPLPLTDDEYDKLSAYLKTHRRKVSFGAQYRAARGDLAEKSKLDQDEARWATYRCTLEYNRIRLARVELPIGPGPVSEAPNQRPVDRRQDLKQPPNHAFAAYRAVKLAGQDQAEVARELGVHQSTISRWVVSVAKWIEAGKVLPAEMRVDPPRRKPMSMDPSKLDQGPRLDRRRRTESRKEGE
jgi:transposase-like protein